MEEIALYDAKTRLSELITEVEQGGSVVITRRGVPVARLVGVQEARSAAQLRAQKDVVAAAMRALAPFRDHVSLDIPLRDAIGSGRD